MTTLRCREVKWFVQGHSSFCVAKPGLKPMFNFSDDNFPCFVNYVFFWTPELSNRTRQTCIFTFSSSHVKIRKQ